MNKAITIKDLATKLNMSFSTVSKALNNDPAISQLTRERVQKLANEWNYIPNQAARGFKLKKTFTIAFIVPDLLDEFYAEAIRGAEDTASREKYQIIICQTLEDTDKEDRLLSTLRQHGIDGLIVAVSKNRTDFTPFRRLQQAGIPVIFFARLPGNDEFPFIAADNEEGAFIATSALIEMGHQRIAHLMGPPDMAVSQARLQGYKKALEKHQLPFEDTLVYAVDLSRSAVHKAMGHFITCQPKPTAVFSFKNYLSLDGISYLRHHPPEYADKIAFAGFGYLSIFDYLEIKPVVSIDENAREMGAAAVDLLLQSGPSLMLPGIHSSMLKKFACRLIFDQ